MAFKNLGVYPVTAIKPEFDFTGDGTSYTSVKDLETISISVDTNVETWYSLDQEGFQSALATGKAMTYEFTGKRNYNDEGNNKIAEMWSKIGPDAVVGLKLTLPNGDKVEHECVVGVSSIWGGDSTAIGALEFTLTGNGKPTYTKAG